MEESLKTFTSRYTDAGSDFLKRSTMFMILMLIVRVVEILWVNKLQIHNENIGYQLYGLSFDFIIIFRFAAYFFIPYFGLYYLNRNIANGILITITSLMIVGYIGFIGYFTNTAILLGSDLFAYSFQELVHIVQAANIPTIYYLIGIVSMICIIVLGHLLFSRLSFHPFLQIILFLMMLESLFLTNFKISPKDFDNEYSYYLSENKLSFFCASTFNYFDNKVRMQNTEKQAITVQAIHENKLIEHEIPYPEYPFFHKDETANVLGNYLEISDSTPPNIIFIIVESLGTAYSGSANYLGSFTPYLDELAGKSLYWKNCLSSAGRTFQVLPTMLGSLPFGETGFNDLKNAMPGHISLPSILKKDGYETAFFYGGEAEFDNMNIFLKRQKIDNIIDEKKFQKNYSLMPSDNANFKWGYGDNELFSNYFDYISDKPSPRMDILLTLSMHSPFRIINQPFFERKVESRIKELKLTTSQADFIHQYKSQFTTIMYFDDAIQRFMQKLSQLPSFKNTIVVITGDHRMPEIPISTQIDRFHVPLLIYSPMVKRAKTFDAVVSQFDVTPTFVSLLRNSFHLPMPTYCSWIGFELDTSSTFRNRHVYPIMRNKNEFFDIMAGNTFLSNTDAYAIDKTFDMEPINYGTAQKELTERLQYFKQINNSACQNNKLMPDSIYSKW